MPLKLTPPKFIRSSFSRRRISPKKSLLSSEETHNLEYAQRLFRSPKSLKKIVMGGSKSKSKHVRYFSPAKTATSVVRNPNNPDNKLGTDAIFVGFKGTAAEVKSKKGGKTRKA